MSPNENLNSLELICDLAGCIDAMNQGDPIVVAEAVVAADLPPPDRVSVYRPTDRMPQVMFMRWPGNTWILLSGIRSFWQGSNFVGAARLGPDTVEGVEGVNRATMQAASEVLERLNVFGHRPDETYTIGGHSYGGAVGHNLHFLLEQRFATGERRSVSFGSPKYGNPRQAASTQGRSISRWVNSDDPVPYAVPNPLQMPSIRNLIPAFQVENLEAFDFSDLAHVMTPLLTISRAKFPPVTPPTPGLALANWLVGNEMVGAPPHLIATYAYRLRILRATAAALTPPVNQDTLNWGGTPMVAPVNPPGNPSPPQIPSGIPAVIPPSSTPDTPRTPNGVVRDYRGRYIVYWNGSGIALMRTRSAARKLSRRLQSVNLNMVRALATDISELEDAARFAANLNVNVQP